MDDGGGGNLPVPPVTTCPVPILSDRHDISFAGDTPRDTELCQTWPPLGPPPPKIIPKMYCVYFPKESSSLAFLVEGCQARALIHKSLGALHAPTPTGHGFDPGLDKLPQYTSKHLWNIFSLGVPQRMSSQQ